MKSKTSWMRMGPALLALTLAACASVDPSPARQALQTQVAEALGSGVELAGDDLERNTRRVDALLAEPLSADAAVQIALLNHRGLQAALQRLGIRAAEQAQAGRMGNPGLRFGRLTRGDEVELETGLHLNLARLLALPWLRELEQQRSAAEQRELALQVLGLAAETRRAWVQAVAAEEGLRYQQQVREAAEAGAELARRMAQAGNFSALAHAREQSFYAEAALGLAQAERLRLSSRERLARLLGLWGDALARLQLPERLPDLPDAAREQPDIERLGLVQRLDLQAAQAKAEQTAAQLGLNRKTRFVNVFELGLERNRSNAEPTQRGWEIGIELPLFDWGDARVAKAEALYRQALHQVAATAIDARSELRETYGLYRHAHDIARHHRDEILPLRKRISEEQLLRYNGMLIGVFELLADARGQVAAVLAALEARRDFWLADADLRQALSGPVRPTLPAARTATESAPAAAH